VTPLALALNQRGTTKRLGLVVRVPLFRFKKVNNLELIPEAGLNICSRAQKKISFAKEVRAASANLFTFVVNIFQMKAILLVQ